MRKFDFAIRGCANIVWQYDVADFVVCIGLGKIKLSEFVASFEVGDDVERYGKALKKWELNFLKMYCIYG